MPPRARSLDTPPAGGHRLPMGMRIRGEDTGGPSEEPQEAPEEEPMVGEKRERSPTPLPEVADIEGPVEMTNQPPPGIPRPIPPPAHD
jgi:hypothetical protein